MIQNSVFCVHSAIIKDLPDVEYDAGREGHKRHIVRRPHEDEIDVYSFPQTWGDTSLGFGGIGGQSITTAQTTVVISGITAAVYFGCRLAYLIENPTAELMGDVSHQNMAEVSKAGRYRRKK